MISFRSSAGRRLAAGLVALALAGCSRPPAGTPPATFHGTDITGVPWGKDFHLTDANGQVRRLADFRGKVVLMFFGYTHCPDFCPTTLGRLSQVMQALGTQAKEVQVLFVTVDPRRDTPAQLGQYVRAFNPAFIGLTGSTADIARTAHAFKVYYELRPAGSGGGYEVDHSANTYVFDRQGRLRLSLAPDAGVADIVSDVKNLLAG